MVGSIDPVKADMRLTQLLGTDDLFAQVPAGSSPISAAAGAGITPAPAASTAINFSGNAFEDMLSKAIESLNGVSRTEMHANQMVDQYAKGQAELADVMVAQAKMSIAVQMAITTVNTAVSSFQQVTQMQI